MKQQIRTTLGAAAIFAHAIFSPLSPGLAFGQQAPPEPLPELDTDEARAVQVGEQAEPEPLPEPDSDEARAETVAPEPDAQAPPEPLPEPDDDGKPDKDS